MLKKTISYVDYFGQERNEDFYFNLTATELTALSLSPAGGLQRHINKIAQTVDRNKLFKLMMEIVLLAYGEKSDDGKMFVKNNGELSKQFKQTPAFDILMQELMSDDKKFTEFLMLVIPKELADEASTAELKQLPFSD